MLLNGIIFSSYYFLLQLSSHWTMVNRVSRRCWNMGGLPPFLPPLLGDAPQNLMGVGLSQNTGETWNAVEKYLSRRSFDSKVAGYKPASLQIY